jgi:hypothetical protein
VEVLSERQAIELVDALAGAVDLQRSSEIDRVRAALVPLGLDRRLKDELRLTGTWSTCAGDCWAEGEVEP